MSDADRSATGAPDAPPLTAPRPTLQQSLRLVVTLAIAGLLSGLVLVGVYLATLPRIQANQAAALQRAVFQVVPGAASMQRFVWTGEALAADAADTGPDTITFGAWGEDGDFLGWAIPGEGSGFQDTISLIFGYNPATGLVIGMRVLESRETPGLGDKIFKDAAFVAGFDDLRPTPEVVVVKTGMRAQPNELDGITGATISSKAVAKIITATAGLWIPRLPEPGSEPEPNHEPESGSEPAPGGEG